MLTRISVILSFGTFLVQGAIDASIQKTYADSMADFTQDFLSVAMKEQGEKNFVFSPFSMHSVLAMLTSGATDNSTTQKELLNGFGRAQKIENLEQLYGQFLKSYKGTDVEKSLKFGNRMWTTPRYFPKIDDDYKSKLENLYGAEFAKFAANNPEKEVNDWGKEVTQGKIDKIVDSVSPETAFLIVNALFFKASWAKSFDEGKPTEFTKLSGQKVLIPMMNRDSKKQFVAQFTTDLVKGRSDKCIALAIPYEAPDGKGAIGRFEILIIMPEHHRGLQFFQDKAEKLVAEKLVAENFGSDNIIELALEALQGKRNNPVDHIVNMPEFKIDTNIEATTMLRKLYIDAPFDDGEFDRIIQDEPLRVGKVKHRATIEVTKDGTVGAAASSIELVALSASLSLPKTVDINKPFLFFVRDTDLNAIVFAGKYADPDA